MGATKIANWYGSGERAVELASQTAVWYSTGLFAVPVRWVLIRDPQKEFETQALLCTDLDADPKKILGWFVLRWRPEVSYQEMRAGISDSRDGGGGRSSSGPKEHPGAFGAVHVGDFVGASADEAGGGHL